MSNRTAEELLATEWWRETDAALLDSLRELESVSRQLYAAMLRVVREVDKRGVSASTGYPNLHALLRDTVCINRHEVKRRIKHAQAVDQSPLLAGATRAGVLGARSRRRDRAHHGFPTEFRGSR